MKQSLLAFGILFTSCICFAQQNLVPNNRFETYSSCPTGGGQVYKTIPWFDPTDESSDYFNVCNDMTNNIDIPDNTWGYQYPNSGKGYAGFGISFQGTYSVREYISAQMIDTLNGGHKYVVEFFSSLSNRSYYGANYIGVYFSKERVYKDSIIPYQYYIPYIPQIENVTVLVDTLYWSLFSEEYIANGQELFITIGNFRTNSNTDTVIIQPYNPPIVYNFVGYYYIDDVSVYCVDSGYSTADAGTDMLICKGDSVQLGTSEQSGFTYSWSPTYGMDPVAGLDSAGATMAQPWIKPQKTTTYILTVVDTVSNCKGPGRDSVTVTVVDTGMCSVGVKEFKVQSLKFKVYPNPASGSANIILNTSAAGENYTLIVSDIAERKIKTYNFSQNKFTINADEFENGIYFIKLYRNGQFSGVQKLVVGK